MALAMVAYVVWFGLWHPSSKFATDPEAWGQLGDYFGSLLRPVVALAALVLLAWSIHIQKEERAETRAALQESAMSQAAMALPSETNIRINALGTLMNSAYQEVKALEEHLRSLDLHFAKPGAPNIEPAFPISIQEERRAVIVALC